MSSNNYEAPEDLAIGEHLSSPDVNDSQVSTDSQDQRLADAEAKIINLQKGLIKSEKLAAIGDLVPGISHELNTPIGICTTGISKLQMETKKLQKDFSSGALSGEQLEKFFIDATKVLDLAESNLRRATDLVHSFKNISVSLASGRVIKTNLCDFLNDTIAAIKLKFDKDSKKVEYKIDIEPELVVSIEVGLIFQVLSNLIINSYLHGFKEDGNYQIVVKGEVNENMLALHYRDSGIGLSETAKKSIFTPFFTTDTSGQGSGLGMSIVHDIITKKLNGAIDVNTGVDAGFSVNFSIPVNQT